MDDMKHKLPWLLQQLVDLPGRSQNKTDLCNSFGTIIPETKHFWKDYLELLHETPFLYFHI